MIRKVSLAALILLTAPLISALAYYDDYSPGELSRTNPMAGAGRKLGRGVSNVVTGWMEIPRGIESVGRESGFLSSLTWGVLQGAGTALVRTAAGVAEIATFPIHAPDPDNSPLVEPEYLL